MLAMLAMQLAAGLTLARQVVPAGPPPGMSGPMNPVTKVVKLLQEMSVQLAEEQKGDEEVYEKYSCWCETTIKEKTDALEAAAARSEELEASIEDGTAEVSKLSTQIKQLKEEREQNKAAVQTATEMRAEEKAEYEASTAEMRATIESIASALAALEKGTGLTALLQVQSHLQKAKKELPPAISSWLQTAAAQPAGFKSYNARSGQIVGILSQMKDDFSSDIAEETATEKASQEAFDKLVAAKKAEIKAATERILQLTKQLTDAKVALVQAKHDLKDLKEQVVEDEKVLADANDRCPKMDAQFQERREQRQEEIDAIAEALKILTDDAARDLFGSTFSFLQTKAARASARAQASAVLQRAALKSGATLKSAALAQLATTVKLDAFDKVKKYITDMIAQLGKEQEDEVEHMDWCEDELRKNAVETKDKKWKEEDLTKDVNDLAATLESLDDDMKELRDAISENLKAIKHASEDRSAANAEFKQTVADQRGAVMILTKVLERLQAVYAPDALKAKREKAAIEAENAEIARQNEMTPGAAKAGIKVANDQKAVPVVLSQQPKGFGGEYKKQSSGGVLGLIEMTIADAQRLVDEAIHEEQESQSAYETLVKDTSASLAADRKSVADKTKERAAAALEKDQAEKDLQATGEQLNGLAEYAKATHAACDFVMQNFALRQSARAEEIDALKNAHAILSGADFQ